MKLVLIFLLLMQVFTVISVHAEKRPFYTNSCTSIDETDKYVLFGTYLLKTKGIDICSYVQSYSKVSGYLGSVELCDDYLPQNGRKCEVKKWKSIYISGRYYIGLEYKSECQRNGSCLEELRNSFK